MADIFGCTENRVEVMGNPRNDEMFKKDRIKDDYIKGGVGKLILWLPTYREYDEGFIISILNKDELNSLNTYLMDNNIKMIVKLHPLQTADTQGMELSHIKFITQDELNRSDMTVYTLLRNADGLITDYSSVYFDYMLLNRPIGFAVEDMEKYKNKRGFIFDNPKEYMPGPEIRNLSDIEEFIENIVSGNDLYKEARESVNDKINYYKDGNCCKRVAETFIK